MIRPSQIYFVCLLFYVSQAVLGAGDKKAKIRDVTFSGNTAFSESQLHQVMLSRPSSFLHHTPYNPQILSDDLSQIERFYHQNGYLDAVVLSHTVRLDTTEKQVDIYVSLSEGPQTRVSQIGLIGNRNFPYAQLMNAIPIQPGDPFQADKMEKGVLNLLRIYAEAGYIRAEVHPNAELDSVAHRILVQFSIDEGRRYRVGEILIRGLERTHPNVILRECTFHHGEWIQYSKLLKAQRALYLTGLFKSVYVAAGDSADPDSIQIPILIDVTEKESAEFLVAVGYGTVDKLRGRVELNHQNLGGIGLSAGAKLGMSFIHKGAELSFTAPWTFGTRWRTDLNFLAEQQEEPGYDYSRVGARAALGRAFTEQINLKFSGRLDRTWLKNVRVATLPDKLKSDLRSITVTLTYDSRDNLFDSRKGFYCEWSHELGRVFTGAGDRLYRTQFSTKGFIPLRKTTVVGSAVELGWMTLPGGLEQIPLQERFYAGGPNSLRGFEYQCAGPLDIAGLPTGGQFKLVWHVIEIRRVLYKMIGAAAFLDAGGVSKTATSFRGESIRSSTGLGLRVSTPFGVARLDFGVNLHSRSGEPHSLWQFSMGQAF